MSVFRSNKEIYVQFIDDASGKTLISTSSSDKDFKENGSKVELANAVGKKAAEKAIEAGIAQVVFDRNGYLYHGRIKALAEGAREGGLKFNKMANNNENKVRSSERIKDRLVAINRVTKVTKGGRHFSLQQ